MNGGFPGEKSAFPSIPALTAVPSDARASAVGRMKEYFPGAKIAVIVRDPRAVFNSLRHYLDHFRQNWSSEIEPRSFAETWAQQNLQWVRDKPDALVQYEQLKNNFVSTLGQTLKRLGIDHTAGQIAEVENAVYSVSKLRPRQPEIYRTGTVDEWRHKLEPEVARCILDIAAPAMVEIGYDLSIERR